MQKHRILVIGSKDHLTAECFNWLENFPNVEEYDSVIINMQSLSQENYDQIQNKIREMRGSINALIDTGREVFCIINKMMYPSPPPRRPGEPVFKGIIFDHVYPTNYDWLPASISFNSKKSGSYVSLLNSRFKNYFELVREWNFEMSFSKETIPELGCSLLNVFSPIAVNKSEKTIAGSLMRVGDRKKLLNDEKIGMVHLLPPPKESSIFQAVERIMDIIIGHEHKVIQPWRKLIEVPNEKELELEIDFRIKGIEQIKEEITQLQQQIQKWDSYRDLLTETGEELEIIVQKTLNDLGIKTNRAEKGFPADLLNREVALEITGIKGCVGADSPKVAQLGRFVQNYRKQEKVILIANTYMDTSPQERKGKMNFSNEMRKYFESLSVCFMTTHTLLELWKDVILKKKEQEHVREKILNTVGEVTASV